MWAVQGGDARCIVWTMGQLSFDKDLAITYAAKGGHLKLIKVFLIGGYSVDTKICISAVRYKQAHILKWLKQEKLITEAVIEKCRILSIKGGDWETFYFCVNNSELKNPQVGEIEIAAKTRNLRIFAYLVSNKKILDGNIQTKDFILYTSRLAMNHLISVGDIETVEWILSLGHPLSPSCCETAIEYYCNGNYAILHLLKRYGGPWQSKIKKYLARRGNLMTLQWVYTNNQPTVRRAAEKADSSNYIDPKSLDESGCCWDEEVTTALAHRGHIHSLKWAYENGCPINRNILKEEEILDVPTIEWLRKIGCDWNESNKERVTKKRQADFKEGKIFLSDNSYKIAKYDPYYLDISEPGKECDIQVDSVWTPWNDVQLQFEDPEIYVWEEEQDYPSEYEDTAQDIYEWSLCDASPTREELEQELDMELEE